MGRHLGSILLAVVIVVAIGFGFTARPVRVEVATVSRGPLQVDLEEEGKTRVIDRYMVSAPLAGVVQRIALEVGDPVRKGGSLTELLPLRSSTLDPRTRAEAEARIRAAEAALAARRETARAAAADATYAAAEHARMEQLFAAATASQEQLERAEADARRTQGGLGSARFAVEVAIHELEAARTTLRHAGSEPGGEAERVAIVSPVDGRVLAIPDPSERVVTPGAALVELGDPRSLEIEVEVLSSDAVRIAPGTPVWLERWGGDGPLAAVVSKVEPVARTKVSALGVEEQRVRVIAALTAPAEQWQRLGDGYRVVARFVLWQADDVLQIPASALFRNNGDWATFVVEGDRAQIRKVEIGRRSGLAAEVRSGLQPGQRVLTHPDDDLRAGDRVKVE